MIKSLEDTPFFNFFNSNLEVFTQDAIYIGDTFEKRVKKKKIIWNNKTGVWVFLGIMAIVHNLWLFKKNPSTPKRGIVSTCKEDFISVKKDVNNLHQKIKKIIKNMNKIPSR